MNTETPGWRHDFPPEIFADVLSHPRRRLVFELLRGNDKPLALADVASEVAAHERALPGTEPTSESVRRLKLTLHHLHLPKLAAHGVVTYDSEQRVVALTERAEHQISSVLDRVDTNT